MLKRILIGLLCVIVAAAMIVPAIISFAQPANAVNAIGENAEEKKGDPNKLTILFEHDMHSHLEKFPNMATVIKQTKEEDPDTLILDAGDFSMGTPYQTIYRNEAAELRMMGFVGFDVTTLGNHEFDYRPAGLADMLNSAVKKSAEDKKKFDEDVNRRYLINARNKPENPYRLPQMVNSNIDMEATIKDKALKEKGELLKSALENYGSKEYTIIEKNGKKIAVFGIFGKQSLDYAPEANTKFKEPVKSAKATVKKIKSEKPDIIIAVSHSGTNENKEESEDEILAREVPDIDLIISGHSHTFMTEPIKVGKTTIVSTGCYNSNIGKLSLQRSSDGERFELSSFDSLPLSSVEPDEETSKELKRFRGLVDEEFFKPYGYTWDQVLTKSDFDFENIDNLGMIQSETRLGNILADSFIYAVKEAEGDKYVPITASIINAGTIRGSFNKGEITAGDAYNSLSIGTGADGKPGYPLVSVYLTGKELRSLAEVDATVSDIMMEARLYISGLMYRVNPHRLFLNRVSEIYKVNVDGTELRDTLPYAEGIGRDSENPSRVSERKDFQKIEDAVRDVENSSGIEELEADKLYRIVGDLYACQMIGLVNEKSKGLLSITPKDKDGNEIEDFEKYIIKSPDGSELKEWYAVVRYMDSFGDNGVPNSYANLQGRKIVEDVKSLGSYVKNPSKIFWMAVGVLVLGISVLLLIIILIVKLLRRIFGYSRRRNNVPTGLFGPSGSSVYRASSGGSTIFKHRKNKYKAGWKRRR